MPPRTRKVSTGIRLQRQRTQFGELETTPTGRIDSPNRSQDHHPTQGGTQKPALSSDSPRQSRGPDFNEFDDELDDFDLINLGIELSGHDDIRHEAPQGFTWSDAGSTTRRSSPVRVGETPDAPWKFDDLGSAGPFSSPRPGKDNLPDTAPLPEEELHDPALGKQTKETRRVDLSETASTARRSSPFEPGEILEAIWDFKDKSLAGRISSTQGENDALPDTMPLSSLSPPSHCPTDDIYDATPPRRSKVVILPPKQPDKEASKIPSLSLNGTGQTKTTKENDKVLAVTYNGPHQHQSAAGPAPTEDVSPSRAEANGKQAAIQGGIQESLGGAHQDNPERLAKHRHPGDSTAAAGTSAEQRRFKRKQRAKEPLHFDEANQEVKDTPPPAKKHAPAMRMPIVSKLRDSAQSSNSPGTAPRKKAVEKPAQRAASKQSKRPQPKQAKPAPKKLPQGPDTSTAIATDMDKEVSASEAKPTENKSSGKSVEFPSPDYKPGSGLSSLLTKTIVLSSDPEDEPIPEGPAACQVESGNSVKKSLVGKETAHKKAPRTAVSRAQQKPPPGGQTGRKVSINELRSPVRMPHQNPSPSSLGQGEQFDPVASSTAETLDKWHATGRRAPRPKPVPAPISRESKLQNLESKNLSQPVANEDVTSTVRARREVDIPLTTRSEETFPWSSRPPRGPQPSAISEKLREQILSSLQQQDEGLRSQESQARPQDLRVRSPLDADGSNKVKEHLYQIVDTMVTRLKSKEEPVCKVSEVYRAKTLQSVGRIRRRFDEERNSLTETCETDMRQFSEAAHAARSAVDGSSQGRDAAVEGLEETLAQRRLVYDRASNSLRAMQRRLQSSNALSV